MHESEPQSFAEMVVFPTDLMAEFHRLEDVLSASMAIPKSIMLNQRVYNNLDAVDRSSEPDFAKVYAHFPSGKAVVADPADIPPDDPNLIFVGNIEHIRSIFEGAIFKEGVMVPVPPKSPSSMSEVNLVVIKRRFGWELVERQVWSGPIDATLDRDDQKGRRRRFLMPCFYSEPPVEGKSDLHEFTTRTKSYVVVNDNIDPDDCAGHMCDVLLTTNERILCPSGRDITNFVNAWTRDHSGLTLKFLCLPLNNNFRNDSSSDLDRVDTAAARVLSRSTARIRDIEEMIEDV